jgi:transposase
MNTTMTKAPETPISRVEVTTTVQRRRRWTTAEKVRLVEEASQPGMSASFVARRAGIAPSQLFTWKRRMAEGGQAAVAADEGVVGASKVRDLQRTIRELERLLGRKTMEAEILREALDARRAKKPILPLVSWKEDASR